MPGGDAPPLTEDEFAALMAPLGPWGIERRVAVAVSGGADSLCLAWLAAVWGRPLGLIVDHGLRAESAAEARLAGSRLAGFGVDARIVRIEALERGPGLAARARRARYDLLARAVADEGRCDLLVGHHAGDQAETLVIRAESGSGPAGLAGMAPIVEMPSMRLVRPLLGVAPERLRSTLRHRGIGWSEDPSNTDPGAARGRIRLGLMRSEPRTPPLQAAAQRAALDAGRSAILAHRVSLFPEGYALLTPGPLDHGCLAALIRALTGADYPARSRALIRLAADPSHGTLGGVQFRPAGRLGTGILAFREPSAVQQPLPAADGAIWDRRWRLSVAGPLQAGTMLGAVGAHAPLLRDSTTLPASVLCTLPALRAPGRPLGVPHLGVLDGWTNAGVRLTLVPGSPVAGAAFGLGDAQCAADPHVVKEAPAARLPL